MSSRFPFTTRPMATRRYDDDEVREIFARATEVEAEAPPAAALTLSRAPSGEGLTLAELQEIAVEAGIDPARVARVAGALMPLPARGGVRRLGVSVSVEHVERLPRILTDEEWDHLVVRLRDTFGAPGTVVREGSLRTWTHGSLRVLLEPQPEGARLRFTAVDDAARGYLEGALAAGASGVTGTALFGVLFALGQGNGLPVVLGLMGGVMAIGAGLFVAGRLRIGPWRERRAGEFAALAGQMSAEVRAADAGRILPDGS